MMKMPPGAFCMDHGSAPTLPRRFPLILEPRARPWKWSDGFPGVWIQKLIPLMPFPTSCKAIVETLRPNSDASNGDYDTDPTTGLNLWTVLDDNSDTDNVRFFDVLAGIAAQNKCAATTAVAAFEVNFANPVGTPAHFDCQGLRWRFRHKKLESGGTWFPGTVNVNQIQLRETTTQRDTSAPGAIGTSYSTTTVTLTDNEYDAIVNHDNLRLRYADVDTCATDDFDGGPTLMIAWVELEYFAK